MLPVACTPRVYQQAFCSLSSKKHQRRSHWPVHPQKSGCHLPSDTCRELRKAQSPPVEQQATGMPVQVASHSHGIPHQANAQPSMTPCSQ